jgi:hypothetical protein
MMSRRQLLKVSLTVCGCATCGGLGIGAFARNAWTDSPTAIKGAGYDLWFIGGQRETIMNGKLAAELDLRTLASRPHLYGIGPIEEHRGEVTIVDSRPALARVASDGSVKVSESFETGVPFFVWAEVPRWSVVERVRRIFPRGKGQDRACPRRAHGRFRRAKCPAARCRSAARNPCSARRTSARSARPTSPSAAPPT